MALEQGKNGFDWRDSLMNFFGYCLLGFVLSYLLYSIVSYSLSSHPASQAFGMIPEMRMPTFADLRWVAATSGCHININDMYTGKSVGCDSFGRLGIGYPPMSLWFSRLLGIKGEHTPLISVAISLSFIGVILSQIRSSLRSSWLLIIVGSLFLISFPVQLGLERMNIDMLIFLLIYFGVLLFSFQAFAWLFPFIILVVSTKFYPFFAFLALSIKGVPKNQLKRYLLPPWLILLSASILGLALSLPWAGSGGTTVAGGGLASHGLSALGYMNNFVIDQLGIANARWFIKLMFGIKLFSLAGGAYMAYRFKIASVLTKAIQRQTAQYQGTRLPPDFYPNLVISMTSTWLGCYVVTKSYDYRMIFLFPILIFIARAIQLEPLSEADLQQRRGLILLLTAMLASMLIQFLVYSFDDKLIRLSIDSISEFVLIPFYASAFFVIIVNWLWAARVRLLQ